MSKRSAAMKVIRNVGFVLGYVSFGLMVFNTYLDHIAPPPQSRPYVLFSPQSCASPMEERLRKLAELQQALGNSSGRSENQPMQGGLDDVVAGIVEVRKQNGNQTFSGVGFHLGGDYFVTAAHVVVNTSTEPYFAGGIGNIDVESSYKFQEIEPDGSRRDITAWIAADDVTASTGNDIALIYSFRAAAGSTGSANPARLRSSSTLALGEKVKMITRDPDSGEIMRLS